MVYFSCTKREPYKRDPVYLTILTSCRPPPVSVPAERHRPDRLHLPDGGDRLRALRRRPQPHQLQPRHERRQGHARPRPQVPHPRRRRRHTLLTPKGKYTETHHLVAAQIFPTAQIFSFWEFKMNRKNEPRCCLGKKLQRRERLNVGA